ncbi:MAG: GTP cyclohydrolase I FolE2 [Proteobacteria bacterium]|nr:GTP cyclohydrolase I FolE2 [Pseudomonadota bacterium]
MNAPERMLLPDVQSSPDGRAVAINRVGVKSVRFPLRVKRAGGAEQATVATIDMYVGLPHHVKGTHMSRFLEVLHANTAALDMAGLRALALTVQAPVTSLCPCSKEISEYGAHNQRSHITIEARLNAPMEIEELVAIAEKEASCEVYGLLKRPDEKYVTERAYDNPKFVEDLVRDIALALNGEARIDAYSIESENFESIHNHSAYALIRQDKRIAR